MKSSTKAGVLLPAIKQTGKTLVLLCLLAMLGLVGAGVSHAHAALTPSGVRMAATNGDIVIGSTVAATTGVRMAASTGDVHIGNGG